MTTADAPPTGPRAQVFAIRSDMMDATFHPAAGGRLGRLRHVRHGDLIVPFVATSPAPAAWPKSGAFPLFPFHNRLRTASFRLGDRQIRLKPNMPDGTGVMHGPAHRRAWRVSDHGAGHIEMTLDHGADKDWPFDFRATQRFELSGSRLTVTLCLTNTGAGVMPGGLGWHPYFRASQDGEIDLVATRQWAPSGTDATPLPAHTGHGARRIRPEPDRTQHYSGWTRASARIGNGARVELEGHGGLSCLALLHKQAYLCLEPVSHVAGALEMPEIADATGLHLLAPGACLRGTAILSVS